MSVIAPPPEPARLRVTMRLTLDGLVPDPHEFEPSLAHYANFGRGRFANKHPLTVAQQRGEEPVVLSEYELPPLDALRGDEMLAAHVVSKTRLSGMPELDASDRDYVTRTTLSGTFHLPLVKLLESSVAARPMRFAVRDPALYESLAYMTAEQARTGATGGDLERALAAADEEARRGATKGQVTSLEVAVTPPALAATYATALRARLDASERDPARPLLYGTKRFAEAQRASEQIIGKHYANAFGALAGAKYGRACDATCSILHMPFFNSTLGPTLPVAYFAPRDLPRLQPPGATLLAEPLYAPTEETQRFYNEIARSAFASVGLSERGAVAAIDRQLRNTHGDEIYPLTFRAIEGAVRTLQSFGNNLKYRSDDRVPNRALLPHFQALAAAAGSFGAMRQFNWAHRARAARALFAAGGDALSAGAAPVEVPNESMNDLSQCGLLDSDDCEDMAQVPQAVHFDLLPARADLPPTRFERYPLLKNAAKLLERYDIGALGSEATTAYVPNEATAAGERASAGEGESGQGHIYARGHPRVLIAEQLRRAHPDYDARERIPAYFDRHDADDRQTRAVAPWEQRLPAVTIEGTGPGAVFVQPAAEVHPSQAAATTAFRALARGIVALNAPDKQATLMRAFSPRQLPMHTAAPADQRARINEFYKADIHFISPRLFELDARLAHLNYVDTAAGTRGVPVERLLRDTADDARSTVGLAAPFLAARDDEMRLVTDVAAVIKNAQPASSMARFPADTLFDRAAHPHSTVPDFKTAMLRVGHPLSDTSVAALAQFRLPKRPSAGVWSAFTRALDNHSLGQRKSDLARFGASGAAGGGDDASAAAAAAAVAGIEKLQPHLDRSDRAVFSMFAPAWALANADVGALGDELKTLYARGLIVDHAFWRDRMLQQCDDQVTLALVVPVAEDAESPGR